MSELNFPTKLIRLTKATLTIVLFNVVLEVIVRRANQQTTGTIYNKETHLLAYADDIDIVGRSQSAVRDAYLTLVKEAANEQKTKYMISARNDRKIRDVGQSRKACNW
jgi:hypothetical protein